MIFTKEAAQVLVYAAAFVALLSLIVSTTEVIYHEKDDNALISPLISPISDYDRLRSLPIRGR